MPVTYNSDVITCTIGNSLNITYSKKRSHIINGEEVRFETQAIQNLVESHFKNRPADKIYLNYNNTFNIIRNQYVQLIDVIHQAVKENKSEIHVDCHVKREILCNVCKQNWFVPNYSHINMCDDCGDCFFD